MQCPSCNYVMSDFDTECPRCYSNRVSKTQVNTSKVDNTPTSQANTTQTGRTVTPTSSSAMACQYGCIGIVLLCCLIYFIAAMSSTGKKDHDGTASAEIIQTRIEPYTNAQGKAMQIVYIDWKNAGEVPIRRLRANINAYNADGSKNFMSASDYYIYIVSDSDSGIGPGESYRESGDEGFVLPLDQGIARVDAEITYVSSEGAAD